MGQQILGQKAIGVGDLINLRIELETRQGLKVENGVKDHIHYSSSPASKSGMKFVVGCEDEGWKSSCHGILVLRTLQRKQIRKPDLV